MEPIQKAFTFAFQDLPALGDFVRLSLVRDLPELRNRSIKYKAPDFLTKYDAGLQAVKDLVAPAAFTAQHKKLTEQMTEDGKRIRPLLNNLDIRLLDAHRLATQEPTGPQLFVPVTSFGLKPLRTAITDSDAEAIAARGKDLLYHISQSQTLLDLVEHPATETADLAALLTRLATANAQQSELIATRDLKVEQNLTVLNDFYLHFLAPALFDGKKSYKEVSPAKTNDYTLRKLLQQVSAARPQKPKPTT